MNNILLKPFVVDEVRSAVFEMNPTKAPGFNLDSGSSIFEDVRGIPPAYGNFLINVDIASENKSSSRGLGVMV